MNKEIVSCIIIVIVLVIVLIIWFGVKPSNKKPQPVEKTHKITVNDDKYYIDGKITPTLNLKRGKRYRFFVDAENHPIYLTTSDTGGIGLPGNILANVDEKGIANIGDFDIIMDKEADKGQLYYQSTKGISVGGKINIV